LNVNVPNNAEQQVAFDTIMESIDNSMVEAGQDNMMAHIFHIITGPGGTGKSALFRHWAATMTLNQQLQLIV
jgi:hypothetical protein